MNERSLLNTDEISSNKHCDRYNTSVTSQATWEQQRLELMDKRWVSKTKCHLAQVITSTAVQFSLR